MRYSIYDSVVERAIRAMRKDPVFQEKTKTRRKKDRRQKKVETVYETILNPAQAFLLGGNAVRVVVDELMWDQDGKRILFVESGILESMEHSSFDLRGDEFTVPYRSFTVAWPESSGLPACLVTFLGPDDVADKADMVGEYAPSFNDALMSTISDLFPAGRKWLMNISFSQDNSELRATIPSEQLGDILLGPECMERVFVGKDRPRVELIDGEAFDEAETKLMHRLFLAVCQLSVYARAFPDKLRPGLPAQKPVFGTRFDSQSSHLSSEELLDESGMIKAHYRKSHYRALRHKRYHRDEEGLVRVVKVRAAVVGAEVSSSTEESYKEVV